MYDIIKHMHEETTASVKHQGILSNIFECCIGVRQGENISRFLFNLFLQVPHKKMVKSNNYFSSYRDNNEFLIKKIKMAETAFFSVTHKNGQCQ